MTAKRKWKRVSGAKLGALAVKVRVCEHCDVMAPPGTKPDACPYCGHLAFATFDSTGECGRWNTLRLLEKASKLTDLRRQVRFDLMAAREIESRTVAAKVAVYVADFVYRRDGQTIIEDYKSAGVIDPVAALKLRWMAAMGLPVKIVTN